MVSAHIQIMKKSNYVNRKAPSFHIPYRIIRFKKEILLKNVACGYSLNRFAKAVLTSTHNLCFEQKYENYQHFSSESFQFLVVKLSVYLNRSVFVMKWKISYILGQRPPLSAHRIIR